MQTTLPITEERRAHPRTTFSMPALCQVGLVRFRVHICDIGSRGMTVLASPLLPRSTHYTLLCRPPGQEVVSLIVREVQRMLFSRGEKVLLRLGLRVIEGDPSLLEPDLPATVETSDELELLMGSRLRKRLMFQLPALLRTGGTRFRCRTLDMDDQGLALAVPANLPTDAQVFDLWFTDPSGTEIPLLVQQKNRLPLPDSEGEDRLGVQILSGVRAYRRFLRRHSPVPT